MSINNNQITIKYFYEGNKLYRLFYTVEDQIASAIPSSHKTILDTHIQAAAKQVLKAQKDTIKTIQWQPSHPTAEIKTLDETLTTAIHKASLAAANSIFAPPSPELTPGSLTISSQYPNFDSFIQGLCTTYLTEDENSEIASQSDPENKIAKILNIFETKNNPDLFKLIAKAFSDYLIEPSSITQLTPSHLGTILELLNSVNTPKDPHSTPQDILLKLQPYLTKNQAFKDNLKLFCIHDVASTVLKANDSHEPNIAPLNFSADAEPERADDDRFSTFYHTSSFFKEHQLTKFYNHLNAFINNPTIKTRFDQSAISPQLPEESTSLWEDMEEPVAPNEVTQNAGESAEAFDARLDEKIKELKAHIGRDIEGLSYTIKELHADYSITTLELRPDMSLDETKRHEKLLDTLQSLFNVIATYDKQRQIKILFCMTQYFISSSTINDAGDFTKDIHKGLTIVYDATGREIYCLSQATGLLQISENRDDETLKTQDLVVTRAQAIFSPDQDPAFIKKQFKKALGPSDYFEADSICLSLM